MNQPQPKESGFNALSLLQQASSSQEPLGAGNGGAPSMEGEKATTSGMLSNPNPNPRHSSTVSENGSINSARVRDRQTKAPVNMRDATQSQLLSLALSGGLLGNMSTTSNSSMANVNQQLQTLLLQQIAALQQPGSTTTSNGNQFTQTAAVAPTPQPQLTRDTGQMAVHQKPLGPDQYQFCTSTSSNDGLSTATTSNTAAAASSSSVVVPCRARGMSMEHNFQTAYFVIKEDIKHGEGLICSFQPCQRRGIRFLYCSYCKDAVAKRNFRNKHNHAGEEAETNSSSGSGGYSADVQAKRISSSVTRPVTSSSSNETSNGTSVATTSSGSDRTSDATASSGSSTRYSQGFNSESGRKRKSDALSRGSSKPRAKTEAERRDAWASLLDKRPRTDDGDKMSAWLMQIMGVSDIKKPLQEVTTLIGSSDASSSSGLDTSDTGSSDDNQKKQSNADMSPTDED